MFTFTTLAITGAICFAAGVLSGILAICLFMSGKIDDLDNGR